MTLTFHDIIIWLSKTTAAMTHIPVMNRLDWFEIYNLLRIPAAQR